MSVAKWVASFGAVAGVLILMTVSPNTAELGAALAVLIATGVVFAHINDLTAFLGSGTVGGGNTPSHPAAAVSA